MFAQFSKYAMLRDIRSISTVFSYLTFSDAVGFSFVLPRFIKKASPGWSMDHRSSKNLGSTKKRPLLSEKLYRKTT